LRDVIKVVYKNFKNIQRKGKKYYLHESRLTIVLKVLNFTTHTQT